MEKSTSTKIVLERSNARSISNTIKDDCISMDQIGVFCVHLFVYLVDFKGGHWSIMAINKPKR